ncbi:hypothetical protein ES703_09976 [subsurface metagenome]
MVKEYVFGQDVSHIAREHGSRYEPVAVVFGLDEPVKAVTKDQLSVYLIDNDRGDLTSLPHGVLELLPQLGIKPSCHPYLRNLHVVRAYSL